MKLKNILVATSLAAAASASMADAVVSMLDLSSGEARNGRNNAVGRFMPTHTVMLASSAYLISSTASSAGSGSQDLSHSILQITDAFSNTIAPFVGNLSDEQNELASLPSTLRGADNNQLLSHGVNLPSQASDSGNLTVSAVLNAVPEPGSLALVLASLGAAVLVTRRRPARRQS